MTKEDLLRRLEELGFDRKEYWVVSGGAMVFIWKFGVAKLGGVFAIYELLPAFIFSGICIVVVSLLTKAPSREIIEDFEAVRNGNVQDA